jgi:colanic acid biosynthesis glycosyl transferase WcaI
MRVLLLTHYFWPEVGAPQVIHAEWIRRFIARGHDIQVVTAFPNYPSGIIHEGYRRRLFMREDHDGATIYRTATYAAPNAGVVRRLLNHTVCAASVWTAVPYLKPFDVVITEYPPLFTSFTGVALARLRGVPHVLNAGDLWVEVAIELGMLKSGMISRSFLAMSTAVEKRSSAVLVTAPGCIDKLARAGVDSWRVRYLPNSVDTDRFTPDPARRKRVRAEMGWEGKTVALYHGTHGLAQGLLQVVETARLLEDERDLLIVLLGDGAEKQIVKDRARELGLRNLLLLDPRPFSEMPGIVDACDIGMVPLKDIPMFRITLPSKLFEFMSMAKPVALAVDGDARTICEGGGAGVFAPPEDPSAYAAAIRRLARDPDLRQSMGCAGRAVAVQRYSRDRFAADLETVLSEVIAHHRNLPKENVHVRDCRTL